MRKKHAFIVPVLTPKGIALIRELAATQGVQHSSFIRPNGLVEDHTLTLDQSSTASFKAASLFLGIPGVRLIPPWPVSFLPGHDKEP